MVQSVLNIAALRLVDNNDTTGVVQVEGRVTASDGNGGSYRWDPNSTAVDNGVTVIKRHGTQFGRWILSKAVLSSTFEFVADGIGTMHYNGFTAVNSAWCKFPVATMANTFCWVKLTDTAGNAVYIQGIR